MDQITGPFVYSIGKILQIGCADLKKMSKGNYVITIFDSKQVEHAHLDSVNYYKDTKNYKNYITDYSLKYKVLLFLLI